MTAIARPINLLDLDQAGLRAFFESLGEQPFRAQQVLKWIYHQGETDFAAMSNLGLELRHKLRQVARIEPPRILNEQVSVDGTTKWLMGFGGGNAIETVFIPEPNRGTLCISSQVGCALNCTFCSTGAQGFSRNLTTAEIIGQVWQAARSLGHERNGRRRITNVVLMGMGEPLLNFDAVVPALALLRDDLGWEALAERVVRPLTGLRVAPYYGCLLLRPYEEIGLDDPEDPTILHDLVRALGAEPVDFPYNIECCGSYLTVKEPQISETLSKDVVASAQAHGAQVIITACPLCQFNLDYPQRETEASGTGNGVPILYFTQLMAVALGLPEEDWGAEEHYLDPRSLLAATTVAVANDAS